MWLVAVACDCVRDVREQEGLMMPPKRLGGYGVPFRFPCVLLNRWYINSYVLVVVYAIVVLYGHGTLVTYLKYHVV